MGTNKPGYHKEYYRKNRAVLMARSIKWKKDNPDKSRDWTLRNLYGISLDDYNRMRDEQGGVCKLCGRPPKKRSDQDEARLSVDHDHKTGRVRGLVCQPCNRAIAWYRDDPGLFERVAAYLRP